MKSMALAAIIFLIFISFYSSFAIKLDLQPKQTLSKVHKPSTLQTYIIHLSSKNGLDNVESIDKEAWYHTFLPKTDTGLPDKSRVVYTYRNVLNGFSARLTPEEVKEMEAVEGFLQADPQRILDLHTTHTPTFLGLNQKFGAWSNSNYGSGAIIGIFDSGVTPNHPSYDDTGMPAPPAKWKGKCEFDDSLCNNKLIGARNYGSPKPELPLDNFGHGTHTSSTAAGNFVKNANVLGNANGTAVGIAPRAHLAIYKVCDEYKGCTDTNILAAMDDAIDDGVDIFSLSLGANPTPFYKDTMAIGAYAATRHGILVSCSAGNSGPDSSSLSNEAPWILTVGAGTIDREIRASVLLGNDIEYIGQSLNQPKNFSKSPLPLIYPGSNGVKNASFCVPESIKDIDLKNKIVFCESGGVFDDEKEGFLKNASAAGYIIVNYEDSGYTLSASDDTIPTSQVSYHAGLKIKSFINSTLNPTATLVFDGTVIGETDAPRVSSFSSRGPSIESPRILKPDIFGPGVNILAAWPFNLDDPTSTRVESGFYIASGTSMSCPHLAGVAALIKSAHPDWSPAAIKSAIMTSADTLDHSKKNPILEEHYLIEADVFAMGSGHVNPSKAIDPGLIYDVHSDDYIPYFCGLGYKDSQIEIITQKSVNCSTIHSIPEAQLNYPSFAVSLDFKKNITLTRTLTNVGEVNSIYEIMIDEIFGVDLVVDPKRLEFSETNRNLMYSITFSRRTKNSLSVQGSISWINPATKIVVRSPISVNLL